jgi:hypothetical protein
VPFASGASDAVVVDAGTVVVAPPGVAVTV